MIWEILVGGVTTIIVSSLGLAHVILKREHRRSSTPNSPEEKRKRLEAARDEFKAMYQSTSTRATERMCLERIAKIEAQIADIIEAEAMGNE